MDVHVKRVMSIVGIEFKVNDVVRIDVGTGVDHYFIEGRIDFIDTQNLILDMSEKYKSRTVTVKYDSMKSIAKIS